MPLLRRIYVLIDTVTRERPREMDDIMIIASGKPVGAISLAEASISFEGTAIVD